MQNHAPTISASPSLETLLQSEATGGPNSALPGGGDKPVTERPPKDLKGSEALRAAVSLWPLDDPTGDASRCCGSAAFGDGMDYNRGTPVAENGVIVIAESDIWRDQGNLGRAVGGHDERKIRDIPGGGCAVLVFSTAGIEVRAGGLKVRRIALGGLMDVDRMFAGRKVLDVQRDFDAFGGAGKHGRSNVMTFGILEFNGYRLCTAVSMRLLGPGSGVQSQEQAHPTYECLHRDHLFLNGFRMVSGRPKRQRPSTLTWLARGISQTVVI